MLYIKQSIRNRLHIDAANPNPTSKTKNPTPMLLDRQFEKFIGGPTVASRDRMHVTISHKGLIYLNANTHRMLGRPVAANLYFNRAKDQIAVEPTSARLPGVFPIHVKREGFIINAGPFCRHFGIRMSGTQRLVEPRSMKREIFC